jgi:hypothetical protein
MAVCVVGTGAVILRSKEDESLYPDNPHRLPDICVVENDDDGWCL